MELKCVKTRNFRTAMVVMFTMVTMFAVLSPFSKVMGQSYDPSVPQDLQHIRQTGKLFTVDFVPADKNFKIYLVGKKAAEIDFDKSDVEVDLIINNKETKRLRLKRNKDHYSSTEPIDSKGKFDIKVRNKSSGESEKFHVDVAKP